MNPMPSSQRPPLDHLIRQYYEAVDKNDLEELLSLFTQDCSYARPGFPVMKGHDDLRRFYSRERSIASGLHQLHLVAQRDQDVAVFGAFHGVLRTGQEVEVEFGDRFTARQNRIAFRQTYFFVPAV